MLDLSAFDSKAGSDAGAVLVVLDTNTGEPMADTDGTQVMITLAGIDSDIYTENQYKIQNKRIRSAKNGRMKVDFDAAELADEGLDLLAACTLAWSGFVWKGAAFPCTPENAKTLYKSLPAIKEQVDSFIADRRNFLPKAASFSSSTTAPQ